MISELESKVCLTTYIYGTKYQWYIPMLVYSCHKAYPEYDMVLFLYDKLDEEVKNLVNSLCVHNLTIFEEKHHQCKSMNSLKAKSLRWVLWDESFYKYDYIYIVDIDMFYIREPQMLHVQHLEHMKTTSLPYDNISRTKYRSPFSITSLGSRIKHAGLHHIFRFLFGSRIDTRASGLHFISVKPYFKHLNEEVRNYETDSILKGKYMRNIMSCNNESYLYDLLKRYDLHPEIMGKQSSPDFMLDFENCTRNEFRPHHGIHLGIFRSELDSNNDVILKSSAYEYYIEVFTSSIMNDPIFQRTLENSPIFIKEHFKKMFLYYSLNSKFIQNK